MQSQQFCVVIRRKPSPFNLLNEECRVGFESQNQSFIQTEQPPDGSIPEITAGVAESVLLDNKNPKENALFCSIK